MQPTEYYIIFIGLIIGAVVGFIAASILANRRIYRTTVETWRQAKIYYAHKAIELYRNR